MTRHGMDGAMSIECLATAIQAACAVTWGPKTPVADRETYLALASEVAKNYDAGINTMACGEGPDRRPKPERTPEVVLRAMLRAYEAATLDAMVAAIKSVHALEVSDEEDGVYGHEQEVYDALEERLDELREETANLIAGRDDLDIVNSTTRADYEARLAGTRPLDAPPLEVL